VAGRYRIDSILAEGGMGVVCLGRHVELDQPVAVKFLRREWADNETVVARFVNEARAAAALRSDHVVRVMDVGLLPDGAPYLVMEHLEGIDLDTLVEREGRLPMDRAIDYAIQACMGLAESHEAGIVHRDIKPENLFLATMGVRGRVVKVVDFGIAKRLDAMQAKVVTGPQDQMGSPCYMSPEQVAAPRSVDARTDVWSMGVVLYRTIAGRVPFDGDSIVEICARVVHATALPLSALRPEVDAELDSIVRRCLEKDPQKRFPTIRALADALRRCRDALRDTDPVRRKAQGSTAPLALDADERFTERDLPVMGPRGGTVLKVGVFALVAAGAVWAAERNGIIEIRGATDGVLTPPRLALMPPDRFVPSWDEARAWTVEPRGIISPDPTDRSDLMAEREMEREDDVDESSAAPESRVERRQRAYREYLRRNGWRPLREVLAETRVGTGAPDDKPLSPSDAQRQ
jgi:hypothetical protein